MTKLNANLTATLIEAIVAENLARHEANGAEPYIHAVYEDHEDRIYRLVDAVADGDDELGRAYFEALFDITYDGVASAKRVFAEIEANILADREVTAQSVADDLRAVLDASIA